MEERAENEVCVLLLTDSEQIRLPETLLAGFGPYLYTAHFLHKVHHDSVLLQLRILHQH